VPNVSGVLFPEQTVEALIEAIRTCTVTDFNPARIAAHVQQFSRARFIDRMTVEIERLCDDQALDRLAPEVGVAGWEKIPSLRAIDTGGLAAEKERAVGY